MTNRLNHLCVLIILLASGALSKASAEPRLLVDGLEGIAKTNVEAGINLSRYLCENTDWQLRRLEKKILKDSKHALQAVGYYKSALSTSIERDDSCWSVRLTVTPGPRVTLSQVSVEIIGDLTNYEAVRTFINELPLHKGQALNHQNYSKIKTEIEILAARFGYFSGEFTQHELIVDPTTSTAEAKIVFNSGSGVVFGEVEVTQNYLRPEIFNDYLVISAGDKFDSHQLINQQQVLLSSGYFSQVKVTIDKNEIINNSVPVKIDLASSKRFSYRFGIGASTDTGPRLSLAYTDRRVNQAGHSFKSSNSFSSVRSEVTGNYSIPQGKAGTNRLDLQLGYLYEDTDNASLSSYKFSASAHRVLSNQWLRTVFVEYLYEDYTTPDSNDTSQFAIPGIAFRKSRIDNPVLPYDGWRLNASLRLAGKDVLSSTDFAQFYFSGKIIKPLGTGRVLARFDGGFSEVGEFSKIPASLRYYAGGDGSVRGFEYKSLGPKDAAGDVIGGPHLMAASVEYEHPIFKNWGVAVFADTGNAFSDFDDYELFTGAGFGIRWHSPIGPIRLDLAQDVEGISRPRFHLSMGLDL